MELINITIRENIATVEMNFNTQNVFGVNELHLLMDSLEGIAKKKEVHVILLTSCSEKYFSNGIDPQALKKDGIDICFQTLFEFIRRIYILQKPLVARLRGYTMAGGAILSILADYRIASPTLRIAFNEILLGLTMKQLVVDIIKETVGSFHAKLICQTGYSLKAGRALEIGLVDFCYENSELDEKAFIFARKLARLNNESLCHMKSMFRRNIFVSPDKYNDIDNIAFKKASHSQTFFSIMEKLIKRDS